jgi:hypothetical protein
LRYLLILAAFIATLTLPLLTPAPVSAGVPRSCTGDYVGISIEFFQQSDFPPGIARYAAAADVNHNGIVCFKERGSRGLTFIDDNPIPD